MINPGVLDESVRDREREPRLVYLEMKKAHSLCISLVGGNAVGIFVHAVQTDSPAHKVIIFNIYTNFMFYLVAAVFRRVRT